MRRSESLSSLTPRLPFSAPGLPFASEPVLVLMKSCRSLSAETKSFMAASGFEASCPIVTVTGAALCCFRSSVTPATTPATWFEVLLCWAPPATASIRKSAFWPSACTAPPVSFRAAIRLPPPPSATETACAPVCFETSVTWSAIAS